MKGCKLTEEELDAMAEAEEYLGNFADCANCKERWSVCADSLDEYCLDIYTVGAEFGYNKALEEATHNYNAIIADYDKRIAELEKENAELKMQLGEWKKCFLSCSSPFCSKHFPTVESSVVLGNMEKKENLKRGTK